MASMFPGLAIHNDSVLAVKAPRACHDFAQRCRGAAGVGAVTEADGAARMRSSLKTQTQTDTLVCEMRDGSMAVAMATAIVTMESSSQEAWAVVRGGVKWQCVRVSGQLEVEAQFLF